MRLTKKILLIADQRPDFIAVHLASLDEISHEDGPFQPTAFAALEALDAMIGDLRKAALAANPRAVVVVTSDHGFRATQFTVNLRVPLVAAGLIKLLPADPNKPPQVASWDVQVWPAGGSAAIMLRNRKDEPVRKQVEELLAKLKSDPKNGIARVLNADDLRRRGAFPEADWVVDCAPGYYAGSGLRGELIAPAPLKGMHGYAPDTADMHAAFFMQGAGVGKHALGVIDMRQLAPTLARVLGVELPSAEQPAVPFD